MSMYVCICNRVTENDIKRAIGDGACSMSCLAERLAVSTCCGQCYNTANACLEALVDADFSNGIGAATV